MGYAHRYADAVMHRGRVPMEPADFVPDWADAPRRGKFYPGVESFALPDGDRIADPPVARGLLPAPGHDTRHDGPEGFTLPLLSAMLKDSYGLTGRRLGIQANSDLSGLPFYTHANWSRGTAGGGGLYPVSVYWITGPSGPLTPGVHYYDVQQHAAQRLLAGDVSSRVRAALGPDAPPWARETDQYLVLGVKYWQNAFKYNSFSYHVVSTDLGTLVATWRIWAAARGLRVAPVLWFDEPRLGELLGLTGQEEALFAVVPLPWGGSAPRPAPPGPQAAPGGSPPAVRHRDVERSRTVLTFPTVLAMHEATVAGAADRPAPGALAAAAARPVPPGGQRLTLPAPRFPDEVPVRSALRGRRSSFGRFDAARPVTGGQLGAVLAACAATTLDSDASPAGTTTGGGAGGTAATGTAATGDTSPPPPERLAALYAFVNHVEGIAPGAYAYDADAHELRLVVPGPQGAFLQENYFLANYNLERAGAVLVPTVRTTAVLDAVGDRGYRLAVGTAGAVAQTFYVAAAALGLGAGVALGFDNISFVERLGLGDGDEAPLLIMPLGNERPGPADFRHDIA
ncbi:nitroreductase family protein [Streptomyces sp. TRM 70351]|uniref:nitroreductase family protein n=1 Tax=Streptomyces sp. TRM 70351 TaxID=3116552 RepID=UPI002E7C317D|nr:nitroreductase family protein [Streptomyces sp. TRM 70351]MEE1926717.1 nitroreductase family protein [Streptomyces sp. TRM 70351]